MAFGTLCIKHVFWQLCWGRCQQFHSVVADMKICVIFIWSNLFVMCSMRNSYFVNSAISCNSCITWVTHTLMPCNSFLSLDSSIVFYRWTVCEWKCGTKHLKPQDRRMLASKNARSRTDASISVFLSALPQNAQTQLLCWTRHSMCVWRAQYAWLCSIGSCGLVCCSRNNSLKATSSAMRRFVLPWIAAFKTIHIFCYN